jgi:hypothetical protein
LCRVASHITSEREGRGYGIGVGDDLLRRVCSILSINFD